MNLTNDLFELQWEGFMRGACFCLLLKYQGTWFLSSLPTTDRQDQIQIKPACKHYKDHRISNKCVFHFDNFIKPEFQNSLKL